MKLRFIACATALATMSLVSLAGAAGINLSWDDCGTFGTHALHLGYVEQVLGKHATRAIAAGTALAWDHLQ